jgi:hypothetical protein
MHQQIFLFVEVEKNAMTYYFFSLNGITRREMLVNLYKYKSLARCHKIIMDHSHKKGWFFGVES